MEASLMDVRETHVVRRPSLLGDAKFEKDRTLWSYDITTKDGNRTVHNPDADLDPRTAAIGVVEDEAQRARILEDAREKNSFEFVVVARNIENADVGVTRTESPKETRRSE